MITTTYNDFLKETKNHWTKENCAKEASKYNRRVDFQKNSPGAYTMAHRNDWLDEICNHMKQIHKEKNWTKEKCSKEALKYDSRNKFQKNSAGAYLKAQRKGWLNDICGHMTELKKPNGYWTKEKCKEEALKYQTKTEFRKNSPSAYKSAVILKIIDEICSHMQIFGNIIKRCVYAYEFSDNSVYIGLTYNIINRHSRHIINLNSNVYKKTKENITHKLKQLTDYVDINKAKELEKFYVDEYKKNNWNVLNIIKTGGLGGNTLKWTKDKCKEEALKYQFRSVFKYNSPYAYRSARINGWLNEICSHMSKKKRIYEPIKWNKEKCREEALKYQTKTEFQKNSGAYASALKNKWLKDICSHMK